MLLLSGTSISGTLEHLCSRSSTLSEIEAASADCYGDTKEVKCECCTICCGDGTTEDNEGEHPCSDTVYYGDVDPIWQDQFERNQYTFSVNDTNDDQT